jgi:hypothetical protein
MVDIAPTISVLLGLNIPAANQGQPLLGMLKINTEKKSLVDSALSNQQDHLFIAYLGAINQKDTSIFEDNSVASPQSSVLFARNTRLKSETLKRTLIVVLILGFCVFFLLRNQKKKIIFSYLLTGIIYGLIFNFRYYLLD